MISGRALLLLVLLSQALLISARPRAGAYRGVLYLNEKQDIELPFSFDLTYKGRKPVIFVYNADERITVDEVKLKGDSLLFRMPVFDTEFRTKVTEKGLEGVWINHYRTNERIIKFKATFGERRRFLKTLGEGKTTVEGTWECTFSPGSANSSPAAGKFHHVEQTSNIIGTFLTETGDYRYLEGLFSRDTLMLSAFDGGHAFLFTAVQRGDSLVNGMFYSGSHWQEPWVGKRNEAFVLRDPDKIALLKDTAQRLNFAFKNTKGKTVTLSDKKFNNRPVIVQLMGSWCPNCMDESRYLSALYKEYRGKGLEIVALAFEKTNDEKKGRQLLTRLKTKLDLDYDLLFTGATGKDAASKTLPLISEISAFPTTIFLNREHKVVRIHTGFNGPATGPEYEKFRKSTEDLVNQLLK
jgi:thiol-disulfide isomerase/thioredoxin